MQSGYFAFSEKLFDDIGKETHGTGFQQAFKFGSFPDQANLKKPQT